MTLILCSKNSVVTAYKTAQRRYINIKFGDRLKSIEDIFMSVENFAAQFCDMFFELTQR